MMIKGNMYCGIDPGASGALAFLDVKQWTLAVFDMPHYTEEVNGKKRKRVDVRKVWDLLTYYNPFRIGTERVHAMPQQDVKSIFTFGRFYGQLEALCAALGAEFHDTDPAVWKRTMQVNSDKDHSRARTSLLVPASAPILTRKTDHDRSEAILLALYEVFKAGIMPKTITLENVGAAEPKTKAKARN